jgi:hypothetical protein
MGNPPDDQPADRAAKPGRGQVQRGNTWQQLRVEPPAVLSTTTDAL